MKVSQRASEKLVEIETAIALMQNALDNLEAEALRLSSGWSGEAQVAYREAQARWSESMIRLTQVIAGLRQIASTHISDVGAFDQRRASAWK